MNFNFNSHAHVERDDTAKKMLNFIIISTHTLTWSVTPIDCYTLGNLSISTHTLTWSVTVQIFVHIHIHAFQLTRSRGA